MQRARDIRFIGMPLSGVDIISDKTVAAESKRLLVLSACSCVIEKQVKSNIVSFLNCFLWQHLHTAYRHTNNVVYLHAFFDNERLAIFDANQVAVKARDGRKALLHFFLRWKKV